jgi:hypothetical protein
MAQGEISHRRIQADALGQFRRCGQQDSGMWASHDLAWSGLPMMLTNPVGVKVQFIGQYHLIQHLLVERGVAAHIVFVSIKQGKNYNALRLFLFLSTFGETMAGLDPIVHPIDVFQLSNLAQ